MIAVFSLLLVLVLSLIVVRVATVALTLTGVSRPMARFQARSAFTGAGFTTSESESVVQHPVRRRIIMLLMLLGNAGVVTAASSLILTLMRTDPEGAWTGSLWGRLLILAAGVAVLWRAASSAWLDRLMSRLIGGALKRWTRIEVRDYASLLHLIGDYGIAELLVEAGDWLAGHTLRELGLPAEGVIVLGIRRADGGYRGAPRADTRIDPGDVLILYGEEDRLAELDERRNDESGDAAHARAVAEKARGEA